MQNVRFLLDKSQDHDAQFTVDRMGEVKLQRPLDYETQNVHQFVILTTDGVTVRNFSNEIKIKFKKIFKKLFESS